MPSPQKSDNLKKQMEREAQETLPGEKKAAMLGPDDYKVLEEMDKEAESILDELIHQEHKNGL